MTRLATRADIPTLAPIALATLRTAWPAVADRITVDTLRGMADQFDRTSSLICVTDAVDAFILTDRIDAGHWRVVWLMPLSMPATTGKELIGFALRREHALRPMTAQTECFARLDKGSNVEQATADSYRIMMATQQRDVLDAQGTVRAVDIFIAAGALAQKLGLAL